MVDSFSRCTTFGCKEEEVSTRSRSRLAPLPVAPKGSFVLKGGVGGRSPPVGERMLVLVVGTREIVSLVPVCRREIVTDGEERESNIISIRLFLGWSGCRPCGVRADVQIRRV